MVQRTNLKRKRKENERRICFTGGTCASDEVPQNNGEFRLGLMFREVWNKTEVCSSYLKI